MRRLALLAVVALALVACSGDDADDQAGSTTTAAEAADATTTTAAALAPEDVEAAASPGCSGTEVLPPGDHERTVTSSGRDRAYAIHVPASDDGEPLPLVVDYHGYSEGGPIHAAHSMLGAYGEEQGFVTVTPDSGYPVPLWNIDAASEDVAMFGDLLDDVEALNCIDTNRVFVTGLSNGAMMTSSLACAYSDRIAAAAPVAGITPIEGCEFARPVPVIAFHGTDDTFLSFDGGLGSSVADLPSPNGEGSLGDSEQAEEAADGPSVPDTTAAWAERNGCDGEPTEEQVSGEVRLLAHPCPAGAEVELYVVDGGGHTWPGSEFDDSIAAIVGHVTHEIDANELMWDFFQQHPLSG